jgi:hypothetical protein
MLPGVGERLRTIAGQHPGRAVGVLAALAVLATALSAGSTDRLTLATTEAKTPVLHIRAVGALAPGSAPFEVAVRTMRTQLSADPAVSAVRVAPRRQSEDFEVLLVRLKGGGRNRDAALTRIQRNLDPGPLTLEFRGPAAAVRAAKDQALDDLVLLLAALPLTALMLVLTVGLRGAGVVLLAAAAAVSLAALACELLAGLFDVSWLALAGAAAAGTLLTLQLSSIGVAGAGPATLLCAGAASAAAFGALALLGVDYLSSLALGGALAALIAVPVSIVAASATLAGVRQPGLRGGAVWGGIASLVGFSRALAAILGLFVLMLMLIAIAPIERLATAAIGAAQAPAVEAVGLAGAGIAALLVTAGLGMTQARRFWLPSLAALAAAVPAVASVGLLIVTFQDGHLKEALDYTPTGATSLGAIAAAGATVAALGAAQAVSLAWVGRETEELRPDKLRVAVAVSICLPAAAVSCLAGAAGGVALGFGSASFEKEFGLAVAAGLVLQLLAVGALLAPVLLRVTYRTATDQ